MRPAGSPQRVVDRRSPHGFKGITERNISTHGQRVGKHRGQAELLSPHVGTDQRGRMVDGYRVVSAILRGPRHDDIQIQIRKMNPAGRRGRGFFTAADSAARDYGEILCICLHLLANACVLRWGGTYALGDGCFLL